MNISWTKASFVGVSATCLSLSIMSLPANAASFEFTLHSFMNGSGSLSFSDSPLTGIGTETTSLADLQEAAFNWSFSTSIVLNSFSYGGYAGSTSSVLFDFQDGELVGLNFISDIVSIDTLYGSANLQGTGDVTFNGSEYTETVSGEFIYYEIDPDTGYHIPVTQPFNQSVTESVTFKTITPVGAVPEPLTMLGAATALSFGTLFKKTLSGKSKKSG